MTANGDYTLTADPGYDYGFSAAVDGKTVAIINNSDGSYTIKNVTGELVIKANSAPTIKTYAATVEGDGSGDVSPLTPATHGQEYTFTVTQASNYDYAVAVTVNCQQQRQPLYLYDPGGIRHRPGGHYGEENSSIRYDYDHLQRQWYQR